MTYGVDLDRLADYSAGLLDGTPEAAEVADLIATSPDWAQAYASLVDADHLVRADLTSLGRTDLVMPTDVVAQLDAALAAAARSDTATERPRLTVIAGEGTGRHSASRPTAATRARRRRNAWLAAAAAAVIAFGGFGVTVLSDMMDRAVTETTGMSGRAGSGAADALGEPAPPAAAPSVGPPRLTASGTNYFAGDLALGFKSFGVNPGTLAPEVASGRGELKDSQVAPLLRRLVDPVALSACLRLVTGAYGGQPLSVDFARFEHEPALVVLVGDTAGRPARVVVVGPTCGQPPNGPDVRYSTSVS